MPWHVFRLSPAHEAAGAGDIALDQFTDWFTKLGGPLDMAMFCSKPPGEHFVTYYLSPATEQRAPVLLRLLSARPGDAPPGDATLMAGVSGTRPPDFK